MRAGACRAPHAPAAGRAGPRPAGPDRGLAALSCRGRSVPSPGSSVLPESLCQALPRPAGPVGRRGPALAGALAAPGSPRGATQRRLGRAAAPFPARGRRRSPCPEQRRPVCQLPAAGTGGSPRPRAGIGAGSPLGVSAEARPGSPALRPATQFGSAGLRWGSSPGVSFACAFVLAGKGPVCPGGSSVRVGLRLLLMELL